MSRILFICMILLSSSGWAHAQYEPGKQEDPYDRSGKVFLIPEFWLSFGTTTYIEVAPLLGYHVNDRLAIGAGPHYIFQSQRPSSAYAGFQTHVFGLKGFGRFALLTQAERFLPINLFSDLFVHAEYEGMSLENGIYQQVGENSRYISHLFLVGGGINQRLGLHSSMSIMVLWNLNETYSSPYSNPVFRIGFNTFF